MGAPVLMVDAAADLRTIVPQLRAAGYAPAIAAVYTTAGGAAGAFVGTPQYVADLHGLGLAVLPISNSPAIDWGYPGTTTQATSDMDAALQQFAALGVPSGAYCALDVEYSADAALHGAYLATVAARFRASPYAGAGIVYGALRDPAFGAAFDAALQQSPTDAGRLCFWMASYLSAYSGPSLPAWGDPVGPASVPWSAVHQAQIVAWQFWDQGPGPCDLSLVRLPLPAYGTEGLWLPDGSVGQPTAPAGVSSATSAAQSTPDLPEARSYLQTANAAIGAAQKALGA